MLGHFSRRRVAQAPFALVSAGDVVAHDQHVDRMGFVVDDIGRVARQLRESADGGEFAEQIEAFAQIIDVTSAAGAVENGAAARKNFSEELRGVFRQRGAEMFFRLFADEAAMAQLAFEAADLFDRRQHAQGAADDFRPDAGAFDDADQRFFVRANGTGGEAEK